MHTTVAAVIAFAALGTLSTGQATNAAQAESWTGDSSDGPAARGLWTMHYGIWETHAKQTARPPRTSKGRNKAIAQRLARGKKWPSSQFRCLDSLWTRESNWNHRAYNSGSGAYGIPQALPGAKMSLVAWDWRSNPRTQIRWGLKYIKGRYGSPCGAWGHFRSHNWY